MVKIKISMNIDLEALQTKYRRAIQDVIDLVMFGLLSEPDQSEGSPFLPGTFISIATAAGRPKDAETAKNSFRSWVLMNGFRDCLEATGPILEEVQRVCALWSLSLKKDFKGQDWNERIVKGSKTFHRLGFPDKVKSIRTKHGADLLPEEMELLLNINRARNCLVHRGGRVAKHDANTEKGLVLRWKKMEVIASGPKGERPIGQDEMVLPGESTCLRETDASKVFVLGEAITLSSQEFTEICWTLFRFGERLVKNVEEHGRRLGIVFRDDRKE